MAGSDYFKRTQRDQAAWPEETSTGPGPIQLALVYRDRTTTLFRDGQVLARNEYDPANGPQEFGPEAVVLVGLHHLDMGNSPCFAGAIYDLRIYDKALTPEEVAALQPDDPTGPIPWAWWPFEGDAKDRTGRFAASRPVGGARVDGGKLLLDGKSSFLVAARTEAELDSIVPAGPAPTADEIEIARKLRHRLLADPHRPTYHFVIPEDFAMPFDPNGAIYWNGRYHMFYIYQDRGTHVFGHASSLDMVHWRHHPPALFPTPDSPEKGIFSGNCFVDKQGRAVMVYHGVDAGNCMATSTDPLLEKWTKLPTNPYLPMAPKGAPYRSWDPFGWRVGDTYYTISGGEQAAVFKAAELTDKWQYVGDLLHHTLPGVELREDISCADLFKLGGKDILLCISHRLGSRYYVGEWKDEQFHPITHERMSWSDNLYFAPETLEGPDGRRVLWAWIFDRRPATLRVASGWSGEMSLPRELTLGPDNRLRMKPLRELERLRYDEKNLGPIEVAADTPTPLEGIAGDAIELAIEIEPKGARQVGVVVRRSPDGAEGTPAFIDFEKKALTIANESGPFEPDGPTVTLRVFVDRSVVEAFADDRQAVVRRTYPTRPDSLGVSLFATGGPATIRKVTAWQMFPSNSY